MNITNVYTHTQYLCVQNVIAIYCNVSLYILINV